MIGWCKELVKTTLFLIWSRKRREEQSPLMPVQAPMQYNMKLVRQMTLYARRLKSEELSTMCGFSAIAIRQIRMNKITQK